MIWVNLDDDVKKAIETQSSGRGEQQTSFIVEAACAQDIGLPAIDLVPNVPTLERNEITEPHFIVQRGKTAGTVLYPHVHADGCYIVSPSRFEKDYVRVRSINEVKDH